MKIAKKCFFSLQKSEEEKNQYATLVQTSKMSLLLDETTGSSMEQL
jgi:hypothetical protein